MSFDDYIRQIHAQSVHGIEVTPKELNRAGGWGRTKNSLLRLGSDQGNSLKSWSNDMKNGPLLRLERCFCLGKSPSKKKASYGLNESPSPYKDILGHENGTLRLLNAHVGKESV